MTVARALSRVRARPVASSVKFAVVSGVI